MVKQQIIKFSCDRANYDLCLTKKYESKENEFLMGFTNHINDYKKLFKQLDYEAGTRLNGRSARELIVPIPQSFGSDKAKIKDFTLSFMKNVGIDPSKKSTLYICSVHQKLNEKGILNSHAHILFSERPILDKPITKHLKQRYVNAKGQQCKKDQAVGILPKKDKVVYFGNKYKDNNGKEFFNRKEFCKECDIAWRQTALEFGLTQKDFKDIFNKPKNMKSLGNLDKAKALFDKGFYKPLEMRCKKQIFNEKLIKHDQQVQNYKKYSNMDRSKLSPIDIVAMGSVPKCPPVLDLSKLWREIEEKDIQNRIKAIIEEVKNNEKSYEEAEEEINEIEKSLDIGGR